ncbi:MAG: metal dependent phosphohydrolase, partial [Firmicutes bacterium]|nr:metal dependent phosphohydrolase [Bacillota bacterium]
MFQQITVEDLHEMVDALTTALDAKNSYMCGHSERVAMLSLL